MADVLSTDSRGDRGTDREPISRGIVSWESIIDYAQRHLSYEERNAFGELVKTANRIRILVTGASGVGKSVLINGLLGKRVFTTVTGQCNLDPVTLCDSKYTFEKNGVEIVVFDCSSLHSGFNNEGQYIEGMAREIAECGGIDLILYCHRLDATIVNIDKEKRNIEMLTSGIGNLVESNGKRIGKDIWKRCLFVLTFANVYEQTLRQEEQDVIQAFKKRMEEWTQVFETVLNKSGILDVPTRVCIAGYKRSKLFESEHWMNDFWVEVFATLTDSKSGALALLRLSYDRIVEPKMDSLPKLIDPKDQNIVLTKSLQKVFENYALAEGRVTSSVRWLTTSYPGSTRRQEAISGATFGLLSLGSTARAGLVRRGAFGAVVESAVGGVVLKLYHQHKRRKECEMKPPNIRRTNIPCSLQ